MAQFFCTCHNRKSLTTVLLDLVGVAVKHSETREMMMMLMQGKIKVLQKKKTDFSSQVRYPLLITVTGFVLLPRGDCQVK